MPVVYQVDVGVDAIETGFGKTKHEALLGCKVVKYVHLENCSTNAFKVKIRQTDLKRALVSGHPQGCMVHVWKNSVGGALWNLVIMEEQGLTWERVCDVGGHNSDL